MKKKTMLVIGIMGILFAVGATSVAMAQITSSHECTPEMMKDMAKNCPEQMMQSENKAMMGNSMQTCTPEMMKDMAKNCPEQMMQSENKTMMGNSMQTCTPEMMKDMAKNCPEQMMQSENESMMGKGKPARENTDNRRESLRRYGF